MFPVNLQICISWQTNDIMIDRLHSYICWTSTVVNFSDPYLIHLGLYNMYMNILDFRLYPQCVLEFSFRHELILFQSLIYMYIYSDTANLDNIFTFICVFLKYLLGYASSKSISLWPTSTGRS